MSITNGNEFTWYWNATRWLDAIYNTSNETLFLYVDPYSVIASVLYLKIWDY